jgi:hypothetical protein
MEYEYQNMSAAMAIADSAKPLRMAAERQCTA